MWQSNAILSLVLSLASIYVLFSALWARSHSGISDMACPACCALAIMAVLAAFRHPFAAVTGAVLSFSLFLSTVASNRTVVARTSLVPLLILFVLTYLATRFRRERKAKMGNAEAKSGRNAAPGGSQYRSRLAGDARTDVAQLGSAVAHVGWQIAGFAVLPAMIAALAEAAADTVSSEIGQAVGAAENANHLARGTRRDRRRYQL